MGFPRIAAAAAAVAAAALASAGAASANVPLYRVSNDPFTNSTSQHRTEVEPDTFAHGSTVVAAFQVGRFFDGGASDIGWSRSADGGRTWKAGFLPGMTTSAGVATSPYERVSDASVAYDAAHGTWIVSSIPLTSGTSVPTVLFNVSTDDGVTFGKPSSMPPPVANRVDLDKNWTVCDNGAASPFRGHCYTELDNFGDGDRELMSTSTDGGRTWSVPVQTAGHDKGLGGQPVVQPDGTVIVPFESLSGSIGAFSSDDGGATWSKAVKVANAPSHTADGDLRTSVLPSAEIDGAGNVFAAWQDCRFRKSCSSNDIVFSRSTDGTTWSTPARVPIDDVTSGADHFIPGLAVDPSTSGSGAHLGLTYYFYPQAACDPDCQLQVGYISSPDGGVHWGAPRQLAGPFTLGQIANTSQGPMVGDYISTSFSAGLAVPVFAVAGRKQGPTFDEAMAAPTSPLAVATARQATRAASSAGANGGQGQGTTNQAIRRD